MESARVRYLRTSFLIRQQLVRKYRPYKALSMLQFAYFILTEIFQPQPDFHPSLGRTNIKLCFHSVRVQARRFFKSQCNIFRTFHLASRAFNLFPLPCSFTSFASSFQAFPCLVKLVVVEKGLRHICLLQNFSCLFLLLKNSLSKLTSRSIGFLSKSFCSALPGCSF